MNLREQFIGIKFVANLSWRYNQRGSSSSPCIMQAQLRIVVARRGELFCDFVAKLIIWQNLITGNGMKLIFGLDK